MGLTDFLRKASGIFKDRAASAIGALKKVTARIPAPIRRVARIGRLATPAGIALAVAPFVPRIVSAFRGAVAGARVTAGRATGFLGGSKVVGGIASGAGAGAIVTGVAGQASRPKAPGEEGFVARVARAAGIPVPRRAAPRKRRKAKPVKRRKKRKRSKDLRGKKGITHRKPRHRGHTRVSFTTKSGQKVRFLAAKTKKGRHR